MKVIEHLATDHNFSEIEQKKLDECFISYRKIPSIWYIKNFVLLTIEEIKDRINNNKSLSYWYFRSFKNKNQYFFFDGEIIKVKNVLTSNINSIVIEGNEENITLVMMPAMFGSPLQD